jgi:hypothetical protein
VGFLFACEGYTFVIVLWHVSFAARVVFFHVICGRLPVLTVVGVLLGIFRTTLLLLGRVRAMVVLVLSVGLHVSG